MDDLTQLNPYEYALEIGLEDEYADLCATTAEMDAVVLCLFVIDEHRAEYQFSLVIQPKDPAGRKKSLDQKIAKARNQQQVEDIITEEEIFFPWRSTVKDNKEYILDSCKKILKDSGMKIHYRKKIGPLLTDYLING